MNKTLRTCFALVGVVAMSLFVFSTAVHAGTCGVGVGTSVLKCSGSGEDNITNMILEISNFVFAGVGVLCLFGIAVGGIVYASAGGDAGKTKQGISYIVNAVIGLAIFLFLFVLLNYLVPGGFFNNAGFDTDSSGGGAPAEVPYDDPRDCGGPGEPQCMQ